MYARSPILAKRSRWAHPRIVGNTAITQGLHICAILFDPCAKLINSADGSVTGDEDIDSVRHAFEQPQPDQVVLDRVRGFKVEQRNQDIRNHIAGDENATLL